ncbi:MAG: response regulator transcription factor [Dactylosporangium sp.]|nr:response regulator transcription factor [Dactylosporangium sp.]
MVHVGGRSDLYASDVYQRTVLIRTMVFLVTGYVICGMMARQRAHRVALSDANRRLGAFAATLEQLEAVRSLWNADPKQASDMLDRSLITARGGLVETRGVLQSKQQLIAAIRDTAAGRTPVDQNVAGKLFSHIARQNPPPSAIGIDLNDRERAVLRLLAAGLANADIAERLHLSPGTVRNYVSAILAKLGVADRTQAAVFALRYGLAAED